MGGTDRGKHTSRARLADEYLAHLAGGPVVTDRAVLERTLGELYDRGRDAWPGIDVPPERFARHLAERAGCPPDPDLRAADLYLACGCLLGLPAALAAFAARYLARVPVFLAGAGQTADVADEVRQLLEQRLVVGEGGRPGRLAAYRGRGSLDTWLRAAALRTALNLERGERRQRRARARAAAETGLIAADPELELVRRAYGPALEEALRAALATLTARERTILRLHFVEGVSVGRVAVSYGVHRATVNRWILAAQRTLFDATRRILRDRLGLSPSECESLIGAVQSRIDVTLAPLLGESWRR